jgi:hypothetical protein
MESSANEGARITGTIVRYHNPVLWMTLDRDILELQGPCLAASSAFDLIPDTWPAPRLAN